MADDAFWLPRRCLFEPIPEIFEAARLLDTGASAHLSGDFVATDQLIREADNPRIAAWTDAIWGKHDQQILRFREVSGAPPHLSQEQKPRPRMPDAATRRAIITRDGFQCRFCGIPAIEPLIRQQLRRSYPDALRWGAANAAQHAAFQCMWLQYNHVLPNGRGGQATIDNMIVTCAACNFGRRERMLEEVGLLDPRSRAPHPSGWDDLTRVLPTIR